MKNFNENNRYIDTLTYDQRKPIQWTKVCKTCGKAKKSPDTKTQQRCRECQGVDK